MTLIYLNNQDSASFYCRVTSGQVKHEYLILYTCFLTPEECPGNPGGPGGPGILIAVIQSGEIT